MTPKEGKCPEGLVVVTISGLYFVIISRTTEKDDNQWVLSSLFVGGPVWLERVYSSPTAAKSNCHKLGGFKQQKYIPSQSWRPEVCDKGSAGLGPAGGPEGLCPGLFPSFWWLPTSLGISWPVAVSLRSLPLSYMAFSSECQLCTALPLFVGTPGSLIQYDLIFANYRDKGPVFKHSHILKFWVGHELQEDSIQPATEMKWGNKQDLLPR